MEGQATGRVDYVRFLRRAALTRWRIAVIGFALVIVPVVAWVLFFQTPTYEATATLFLSSEKTDSTPAFMKEYMSPQANSLYLALLKSRSLAQAVGEALTKESREELQNQTVFSDHLLTTLNAVRRLQGKEVIVYSPQEQIVRELQAARVGFAIDKEGTVAITALAYNPRVAVDLANTYVEVLLSRSSSYARQQARTTRELLETMLGQARTDQEQSSEAFSKFRSKSGVGAQIPGVAQAQAQKLGLLETNLAEVMVQKEIAQSRLAFLRGDSTSGGSLPMLDSSVTGLRDRLTALQSQLAALTDKYTESHPLVVSTRAEIQDVQERLRAALAPRQAPRPGGGSVATPGDKAVLAKQMAELEVELMSLRTKEELINRQAGVYRRALSGLGVHEQEYVTLSRSAQTGQNLVGLLNEKLTAARITEQTQIRSLQVVDTATLPRQPSAKASEKILLFGLVGSLALGLGVGTLREWVAQVIETEDDVTAVTGLPVLGSVPGIVVARRRRAKGRLTLLGKKPVASAQRPAEAPKPMLLDPFPKNFLKDRDPRSLHAEAFRAIRTTLQLQAPDRPLKTILVTSPAMSEGKTTVLLNLGLIYVESGRRVLMIDGDLRRPALHQAFGIPNEGGLADVLQETRDWTHGTRKVNEGLSVMPSGNTVANPSSLLNSRVMDTLIQRTSEAVDLVLIDAPPVLAVSDSLRLTSLVDAVILVVRAGVTERRNLIRAKAQLDKVGAPVVGVVINDLSSRETRKYYGEYSRYAKGAARRKRGA